VFARSYAVPVLWPVSAKAVIVQDGCVLLARNDRDEWELPGGRVERGEEPAAAAVREVAEETGLLVQATAELGTAMFEVVPDQVVLIVAFHCVVTDRRELVLSEEHEALQWQPLAQLDAIALPEVYRGFIARAARGRVLLMGDSHLAKLDRRRIQQLRALTGDQRLIVNHATGGSTVLDLLAEIETAAFLPQDRIVISVGTNDYAPWKRVPLDTFRAAVDELLDRLRHHRLAVLLPPPVDAERQPAAGRADLRTEQDRAPYAAALAAAAAARQAEVVEVTGDGMHAADGVHLNDAGYERLLAGLARALTALE
jgi:8-oxo-dGTP pyrophosphatase MutT (NUDIX family)/lysophospholipase L1-like esterase